MTTAVTATRGVPRVLRGVSLAGCSAALSVAAHTAAGGSLPPIGLTIVLTTLLAGAAVALADRRRAFPPILAVVAIGQLGTHLLLDNLGHAHHAPSHPVLAGGVAMTALHAIAALVTAVLLAGAEASVFAAEAALRWLLRVARTVAVPPVVIPDARPRTPAVAAAALPLTIMLDVTLRRVHARRGPPDLS